MAILQKPEIIEAVSKRLGGSKKAATDATEAVIEVIAEQLLKGNAVKFQKFGQFEIVQRGERKGRNPKTGEVIDIPASMVPAFRVSKIFKQAVNESKAAKKTLAKVAK